MTRQSAAIVCLIVLVVAAPGVAQEVLEIPNWSAPLFFSLPKIEKPDTDSPETAEPLSAQGTEVADPELLPLVTVPPCRIADTRGNGFSGQAGPPALNTGPRVFQITGTVAGVPSQCGIPTTARAVSFQFTIVTPNSAGNLIAWPGGPAPTISVLNWSAGETALGNGTVVPISVTGSLSVQINAAIGGATGHLVLDVNGYYGPSLDGVYVNEGQASSVSSSMIADGAIVDADINASAAIADTKLATIATAGKVADTALSSAVTKLGQSIEGGEIADESITASDIGEGAVGDSEIADTTRIIQIPLTSFVDCESTGALIDFASGNDNRPDFESLGANGAGFAITFDDLVTFEDQGSEICSQMRIPYDYTQGTGSFQILVKKDAHTATNTEVLNCALGRNDVGMQPPGTAEISSAAAGDVFCVPVLPVLTPGQTARLYLSITSSGTMDDTVRVLSVQFSYASTR
jgi:hypothetical protein